MALDFHSFGIDRIGPLVTSDRFGWVRVSVGFADSATATKPLLRVGVPIQYEGSWTVEQLHEAAFDKAKELLAAASQMFEKNDLQRLQEPGTPRCPDYRKPNFS